MKRIDLIFYALRFNWASKNGQRYWIASKSSHPGLRLQCDITTRSVSPTGIDFLFFDLWLNMPSQASTTFTNNEWGTNDAKRIIGERKTMWQYCACFLTQSKIMTVTTVGVKFFWCEQPATYIEPVGTCVSTVPFEVIQTILEGTAGVELVWNQFKKEGTRKTMNTGWTFQIIDKPASCASVNEPLSMDILSKWSLIP